MTGIAPKLSTACRFKGMWRWRIGYSTPTSAGFHTRVLVSNLLHNPADNRSTINSFCKTAIIDRLLGRLAEKSRRISNRMLDEFHVKRHEYASRHGKALKGIEPCGQHR